MFDIAKTAGLVMYVYVLVWLNVLVNLVTAMDL